MRKRYLIVASAVAAFGVLAAIAWAAPGFNNAHARVYDPAHTQLAASGWIAGTGCVNNAATSSDGKTASGPAYSDPACPTGDSHDNNNDGLLLSKIGPTGNYAAGVVDLNNVKNMTLTELGYDIRTGSHCGAGAPRFDVVTADGEWFVGCASPPPTTSSAPGQAWQRLRWGNGSAGSVMGYNATSGQLTAITGKVKAIQIVFDEGEDQGNGYAILDNIDVNGQLVGHGNPPSNG